MPLNKRMPQWVANPKGMPVRAVFNISIGSTAIAKNWEMAKGDSACVLTSADEKFTTNDQSPWRWLDRKAKCGLGRKTTGHGLVR